MRFYLVVCTLSLVLLVFVSHLKGAVVFRFTNLVCLSYNESWLVIHNCRLKAVSRDRVTLNLNASILHPASVIHVQYKVFKKANGFKPWLFEGRVDICRFLRSNYNPFFILIFNLLKEFTNFNTTCPLVGPQIIKRFYLRSELLHLPLPTGDYMVSLRWFFEQKLQFDTNASFVFIEDLRKS